MGRSFQMQELHDRVDEIGRSQTPSSLPSVCLIPPLRNQCPQISVKKKVVATIIVLFHLDKLV